MKITVQYPRIMNMELRSTFDMPERSTLHEIEQRALKQFLDIYPRGDEELGKLTLSHKEFEIVTDETLHQVLSSDVCFQAWFPKWPSEQKSDADAHYRAPSFDMSYYPTSGAVQGSFMDSYVPMAFGGGV